MLPGNLALGGWFVVTDDGCDPWRGIVSVFIPWLPVPITSKPLGPLPFCKLIAGKSHSVGQHHQKVTPSAKTGVFDVC